jgi:2-polyprenyl-3-methyl-5-hydroxy-6-metoxy-1,4-benzoquinol methylase
MDKAGKKYWDDSWAESSLPAEFQPSEKNWDQWVSQQFHGYFKELFKGLDASRMTLLEIGCAKSIWLSYFVKEYGFQVTGLDYSQNGCELSRQLLKRNNVNAEIVCSDFFSPPENLLGKFDIVISFGVVEHFKDTSTCLKAVSKFLKPDGMLITSIPNMVGWNAAIQKIVNKPVYDIHELIDTKRLRNEYEKAGLDIQKSEYFMSTNFGVCNLAGMKEKSFLHTCKKILLALLARFSQVIWRLENIFGKLPATRLASPYIICVGRKQN